MQFLTWSAKIYVPPVNAFNKGKYLNFVTYFQSLNFEGFPTLRLRLQMVQFELGLSKSTLQSP